MGSTFKLATLAALRAQVDTKQRSWRDVVELSWRARSLPPASSRTCLDGLRSPALRRAALMISRSDNTATDTLIRLVAGQGHRVSRRAQQALPDDARHVPLQDPGNEALLARYRAGDEAARRALLDELANTRPRRQRLPWAKPTALDVEWFFTA